MEQAVKLSDQEVFEPYELLVNEETGEIIEQSIAVEQLPAVGRRLIANQELLSKRINAIQAEIERLKGIQQRYIEQHNKQESFLLDMSRQLVESSGQKKLEYPGIGCFRFRKIPESVNSTVYEEMETEDKNAIHNNYRDFFKIKTTISPDKKAIKKALQDGAYIEGFEIKKPEDKFEFKAE